MAEFAGSAAMARRPACVAQAMSVRGSARMRQQGTGVNIIHLVSHGTVRSAILRNADRAPAAGELETMKGLVDKAMREGAAGLSSG